MIETGQAGFVFPSDTPQYYVQVFSEEIGRLKLNGVMVSGFSQAIKPFFSTASSRMLWIKSTLTFRGNA